LEDSKGEIRMDYPLTGIRVLSMAEQYPGPYSTLLLADLGADVVLLERPGTGDPSRFAAEHFNLDFPYQTGCIGIFLW